MTTDCNPQQLEFQGVGFSLIGWHLFGVDRERRALDPQLQ